MTTEQVLEPKIQIHEYSMELSTLRKQRGNEAKLGDQITRIVQNSLSGGRERLGWSVAGDHKIQNLDGGDEHLYTCILKYRFRDAANNRANCDAQWKRIVRDAETIGKLRGEWTVSQATNSVQGISVVFPANDTTQVTTIHVQDNETAEIPVTNSSEEEFKEPDFSNDVNYSHIYGRGHQISIVESAIQAAIDSDFDQRFHVVLYGPPGCGKTEIVQAAKAKIGASASVIELDGTSFTKAGAQDLLLKEETPDTGLFIVEEIEKGEENAMKFLLGLMDKRAKVQKTNARGDNARQLRYCVICTVNNKEKFDKLLAGALSDRFSHQIFCPTPTRSILEKILHREVSACCGNSEWIRPALDYCIDTEKTTHPRRAIAVCLTGRDKLLDGSYQHSLKALRAMARNEKKH